MPGALSATAGLKCLKTTDLVVRGNRFEGNKASASIWLDSRNRGYTVEDNDVSGGNKGIWVEISYGGVVRNNRVRACGSNTAWIDGAGIMVSNSPGVRVEGNAVDCFDGITGTESPRSDVSASEGLTLRDLLVTGNTIRTQAGGVTGVGWSKNATDTTTRAYVYAANNRFVGNRYTVPSAAPNAFYWSNGARSWTTWRGIPQDGTGTITLTP
jgi:parallel beta-helix repeat protein